MPFDPDDVDEVIAVELDRMGPEIASDARDICSITYPPASAPGEAPHLRTGLLANSFGYEVERGSAGPVLYLTNDAPYFDYLQDGTSRMAARPFVTILMAKWEGIIAARISGADAIPGFGGSDLAAAGPLAGSESVASGGFFSSIRSLFGF